MHAEPTPERQDGGARALAARHAAEPALAQAQLHQTLHDIRIRDAAIGSFVHLADPDALVREAGACVGPLAGIPVGVKDIFDTRDLPTQYGCPAIYPARPAAVDAAVVAALRRAGAWVIGKTTTTEFAYLDPAPTHNPAAPGRTPGGSSAGSAAAVAAGVVPLAIGSQTGGSTIRPASYVGIVGYMPTARFLPTSGLKCFSWSLDTVGLFARTVDDVAWFAQALGGRSLQAPAGRPHAFVVGIPQGYPWGDASPSAQRAVERARDALERTGVEIRALHLPAIAAAAFEAHADIQGFEATTALRDEFGMHRARLSPLLRTYLEAAAAIDAAAYDQAQAVAGAARLEMRAWLGGCDALLTPSAPDEPPEGLASTGPSTFNRLWTLLGWPCVNVPGLSGLHGAPMGVQLTGPAGADAQLLALARRLERALAGAR
jgi:Asp-tRNA(Asn)/Glu-tRNA(Gln) amidotransferase A subunit family amidase